METNPNDMSCRELVELVTDYLEGALSPADQQRFELHIGKCDWCKLYIDQIRLTIKAAGKLTEDSIEPRAKEELLAIFRGWKNS
jgi:predicted anti-sigma-YlaC factor YlaD